MFRDSSQTSRFLQELFSLLSVYVLKISVKWHVWSQANLFVFVWDVSSLIEAWLVCLCTFLYVINCKLILIEALANSWLRNPCKRGKGNICINHGICVLVAHECVMTSHTYFANQRVYIEQTILVIWFWQERETLTEMKMCIVTHLETT